MKNSFSRTRVALKRAAALFPLAILLLACSGGGEDEAPQGGSNGQQPPPSVQTFSVGGSVAGLAPSTTLTLLNNGSDAVTIGANGTFTFPTKVERGLPFAVTVAAQPGGQNCSVDSGTGTAAADTTSVSVTCSRIAAAYVVNKGSNTIAQFAIAADGALKPMALPSIPTGTSPVALTIDPTGKRAYVINQGDNTVSMFRIGADGSLPGTAAITTPTGGNGPSSIAFTPSGRFAYIAHNDGTATIFSMQSDGSLTATGTFGPSVKRVTAWSDDLIFLSQEGFAYAALINPVDGSLTLVDGIGPSRGINAVAVAPGAGLMVEGIDNGYFVTARFDASGVMRNNGGFNSGVGTPISAVLADPSGINIYAADSGRNLILWASGDPVTGYALNGTSLPTGQLPMALAFDPARKFIYAVNLGANSVSRYSIGSAGELTPLSEDSVVGAGASAMTTAYVPLP
ncbi:lactonase family protein [Cupriavidus pauculus]|uniref:Lactonase family protein n=1 Tax=Cupriavidus pauculus TaxID=82633 RepID=A0A2N5CBH5_9BURK|nr:beta-propeller fold lactonase family protein [Cupriavidus pauculus]PLP99534.1 hypothetical protein CYJ10_17155 [Cupriavidus pauculus]